MCPGGWIHDNHPKGVKGRLVGGGAHGECSKSSPYGIACPERAVKEKNTLLCYYLRMPKPPALHHRLWHALEANDLDQLNGALRDGANPNTVAGGWVPLGKALRKCDPALSLALIRGGADVNASDQREPLINLAAGARDNQAPLDLMLAMGSTPTTQTLAFACRAQAKTAVDTLLSHGTPALAPMTNGQTAPLCWWIMQNKDPAPEALLRATFASPHLGEHASVIAQQCARQQSMQVLHYVSRSNAFPEEARHDLLAGAIHSQWREGVDFLLQERMVRPCFPKHSMNNALAAAYDVHLRRKKQLPDNLLERLVEYGFTLDQCTWRHIRQRSRDERDPLRPVPIFLHLIQRSSAAGRRKFISRLLGLGAPLQCRMGSDEDPQAGGGLVHLLLRLGDVSTAYWVLGRSDAVHWEQGKDPGLVCTLLERSVDADTPSWLGKLVGKGADVHRRDENGDGAWDLLLDQIDTQRFQRPRPAPDIEHVRQVGEQLARVGSSPDQMSREGGLVRQRMRNMSMDEAWISTLDAWSLQSSTAGVSSAQHPVANRRL